MIVYDSWRVPMDQIFNWLSGNPLVMWILLGLFIGMTVLLIIASLHQGREMSFGPIKIGPKLVSSQDKASDRDREVREGKSDEIVPRKAPTLMEIMENYPYLDFCENASEIFMTSVMLNRTM